MEWLSQGALPFGMLFFGSMVLTFVRRRAGHHQAIKEYPKLAERLGLTFRPSAYRTGVGKLTGHYQGFVVVIDPDDQRRIQVRFESAPAVDLRNYSRDSGPPHDMRTVFTRDKKFDGFFKTRWAGAQERSLLEGMERPSSLLEPFRGRRELQELTVTSTGVSCVFDYGNPPYIPADVVETFLPAMVRLGRVFEGAESNDSASLASGAA